MRAHAKPFQGAADFVTGQPVYVRFRDATGNVSRFCRVSGKGKPGGPARGTRQGLEPA